MKKTRSQSIMAAIVFGLLTASNLAPAQAAKSLPPRQSAKHYDVAAYVWPAYHPDDRAKIFWPLGIGEWETIMGNKPKFEGHDQPHFPIWGYVNEADRYVMEMEIAAAADHGVNVFIYGWDHSPRTFKDKGSIITNNTPENFEQALRLAKAFADAHPKQAPLITINSWNEWSESSYLEPDTKNGYSRLEAVRRVFGNDAK